MGFEWLASLGSVVELIGSLIPRRIQIAAHSRGVKYVAMKTPVVLQPGNHWLWPFRSEITVHIIKPRQVNLTYIDVTNIEGKPFRVDAAIQVSIYENDTAILQAFFEHDRIEEIIASEAQDVLCSMVATSHAEELYERLEFNARFTSLIRKRLKRYGVRTHKAYVATLVTGKPILLVGSING